MSLRIGLIVVWVMLLLASVIGCASDRGNVGSSPARDNLEYARPSCH